MTSAAPPLTGRRAGSPELMPADLRDWVRILRRIRFGRRRAVRTTALMLATWADPDGTHIYPSVTTLAASTEQGRRTVLRHLSWLREEYLLIERLSRGGGRGRAAVASQYRLTIPTDLLERCELLDPDHRPERPPPPIQVPPQPTVDDIDDVDDVDFPARRPHLRVVRSS